ncbi:MAG: hypothetical protein JW739_02590 [Opitutales bacterium]|nr:hypothetical protein [Opitutales bacterium]
MGAETIINAIQQIPELEVADLDSREQFFLQSKRSSKARKIVLDYYLKKYPGCLELHREVSVWRKHNPKRSLCRVGADVLSLLCFPKMQQVWAKRMPLRFLTIALWCIDYGRFPVLWAQVFLATLSDLGLSRMQHHFLLFYGNTSTDSARFKIQLAQFYLQQGAYEKAQCAVGDIGRDDSLFFEVRNISRQASIGLSLRDSESKD